MRSWLGVVGIFLALGGCDNKQEGASGGAAASATATASSTATAASTTDAGEDSGKVSGPPAVERPLPKGQTMVGSGMPIEIQQKAVSYMAAMRAPHPDDAAADTTYAKDLVEKLKPIAMSMDTGGDKGRMNRVEMIAGGRQIDILMSAGCDEKAPFRAVATRAGVPLAALVTHGVLVVRCNDAKIQCLQSTRDPDDVLCTTAPRHK
jgi:hypothetical protein